jgi:hypothetical protein
MFLRFRLQDKKMMLLRLRHLSLANLVKILKKLYRYRLVQFRLLQGEIMRLLEAPALLH